MSQNVSSSEDYAAVPGKKRVAHGSSVGLVNAVTVLRLSQCCNVSACTFDLPPIPSCWCCIFHLSIFGHHAFTVAWNSSDALQIWLTVVTVSKKSRLKTFLFCYFLM